MPAAPKSKPSAPSHVLVWNHCHMDSNGQWRAGNIILNHLEHGGDGRPVPVIHPITVGLALVPRAKLERAIADAKAIGPKHSISKAIASKRLRVGIDLTKLPLDEAKRAVEQTASKSVLQGIIDGKIEAPEQLRDHTLEILRTWGTKTRNVPRVITEHFASFDRAS